MKAHILHVEDEPDDALFVQLAFEKAADDHDLILATNGEQAINYLSGTGKYADRKQYPFPDVVLLDLKLPGVSGFDVLKWTRSNEEFRNLPVMILSGSSLETDMQRARQLGANAYLVKTPLYEDLVAAVDKTVKWTAERTSL